MSVIAELFVKLGVKGGSEAQKTLGGVKSTLGEISTEGLAAKAAILGAVYGLQRLTSHAGQTGTDLLQFAAATGMSIDMLQRYQYQAKLFNVSGEEMESTISGLQKTMLLFSQGKGTPSGLGKIVGTLGLSGADIERMKKDTTYALEVINKYLQVEKNIPFANDVAESMGYSKHMIAASRRGAFTPGALSKAPVLKGQEAKNLDATNVEWKKMSMSFELMIAQLTSQHGMGLVKDIAEASKGVIALIKSLFKLNEVLPLIKLIGMSFEGWGHIFNGIAAAIEVITNGLGSIRDNQGVEKTVGTLAGDINFGPRISPKMNPSMTSAGPANTNNNVVINIDGSQDPRVVGEIVNLNMKKIMNKGVYSKQAKAQKQRN